MNSEGYSGTRSVNVDYSEITAESSGTESSTESYRSEYKDSQSGSYSEKSDYPSHSEYQDTVSVGRAHSEKPFRILKIAMCAMHVITMTAGMILLAIYLGRSNCQELFSWAVLLFVVSGLFAAVFLLILIISKCSSNADLEERIHFAAIE